MDSAVVTVDKETVRQWELINPEGIIASAGKTIIDNRRPVTLEGKTVALLWNAKSNGDLFLGRIGELLAERVKGVKVVKLWEADPETKRYGPGAFPAEIIEKVKHLEPAVVFGAQGD